MPRHYKEEGILMFLGTVGFIIIAIVAMFNGNFVPAIIVIAVIIFFALLRFKDKIKNKPTKDSSIPTSTSKAPKSNSITIIFPIIIVGAIISLVFQHKRQDYKNEKHSISEQISTQIPEYNSPNEKQIDIIKEKDIWNKQLSLQYNFIIPRNLKMDDELSNKNFKIYLDKNLLLSLSIASNDLDTINSSLSIEKFITDLPEIAKVFNDNNREKFDDFELVDFEMSHLGHETAMKIVQSSTKVSNKDIEMKIISFSLINNSKYYNITYSYPKNNIEYDSIFERIHDSFKFTFN